MSSRRPLVGIPADRRQLGHHPFHVAGDKYAAALLDASGCLPVIIPAIARELDLAELLDSLDGLLFMGSPTHIEPHHYEGPPSEPGTPHDPHRDATTLPLIPRAVAAGVPVFGICRGAQEMNVAYGGTLWQRLQDVPGCTIIARTPTTRWISSTARRTRCTSCPAACCSGWHTAPSACR